MRLALLLAFCLLVAPAQLSEAADAPASPKRPNILIILADDMGYSDIGCYGGEIRTPNLDALAAGGLRFTQFYNAARCCPTRAALLTGLYPHQAGVGHMVDDKGHPSYQGHLNDRCVTLAEVLRPAGYHTLHVGKWHVGEKRPNWPSDRGFERSFSLVSGGSNYFLLDKGRTFAEDGKQWEAFPEGWYTTDNLSAKAVEYVRQYARSDKPFFMYLAYTAPHWPLHALPEDIARYRGKYKDVGWDALRRRRLARMIELGVVDRSAKLTPRDPRVRPWDELPEARRDDLDLRMAVYAAQIDRMDQGIGRVVAALRETGVLDDTLILFLADNGACAEIVDRGVKGVGAGPKESFLSYGIGWANASNTPFRLYKHHVHEGGISTPLIAHWPARVKAGQITGELAHLIDLMPTCLEVAGATYPTTFDGRPVIPAEGRSLLPTLEGRPRAGHEALFWEHEGNRAVRQGDWKLVGRHNGPWELYHIGTDRSELNDLAPSQADRVRDMAARYEAWAKRVGVVPWATLNARRQAPASRPATTRPAARSTP